MTDGNTIAAQRIIYLITGYIADQLSVQETAELEKWIAEKPENKQLFEQLTDEAYRTTILTQWQPQAAENSLQNLKDKIARQKRRALWPRIAVAASVLMALSFGSYFLLHKQQPKQFAQNQKNDIAPGHNQATLTLAGGRKIIITKNLHGQLAIQGNTLVNAGNAISYTTIDGSQTKVEYNTLSTAKGEQSPAPLVLADGTKVMLNAASSITFPTAFPGNERNVTVTGEATFVVVHNDAKPFKIKVAGQTVQDIGTEFNINAYNDEPTVKVTLASGKVKIIKDGHEAFLNPGQEAITSVNSSNIRVKEADLDVAFAWRNGMFLYDNEPLETIMRKVARWYDVDIIYDGADKNKLFGGGISRYKNVSQVLRKLELTGGVHFTIEGRRIIARK